ncbi:molybdate ABC transporter substrate-binding protein [Ornithinimicrobium panacihumi]|uniref:molybdate ABC transporter substrate-binding protein n=1 Tax=Ornithinimicrobium panacihumi TaxID=2008449 RepID=UPI003F8BC988
MRRRALTLLALPLLLPLSACGGASDQTITVLAAASLTDVFKDIATDFEDDHDGVEVEFSFAASSTIVQQVNEGAPADVVALAGISALEPLTAEHRTTEPVVFATNSLMLAVPTDNPADVDGVDDLTRDGLRLVVCAGQVPCGGATDALFDTLGISPQVASYEQDVRATLTKVELGEADVGIVYRTDVAAAGDRVTGIEIPHDVNVVNTYPILTVSERQLAQDFVNEVFSERGRQHLIDAGFVVP